MYCLSGCVDGWWYNYQPKSMRPCYDIWKDTVRWLDLNNIQVARHNTLSVESRDGCLSYGESNYVSSGVGESYGEFIVNKTKSDFLLLKWGAKDPILFISRKRKCCELKPIIHGHVFHAVRAFFLLSVALQCLSQVVWYVLIARLLQA